MSERLPGRVTGAALFPHTPSPYAEGEKCQICGEPAKHKVGEEDGPDDRHNWTTYLCCEDFGMVMGPVVSRWCRQNLVSA